MSVTAPPTSKYLPIYLNDHLMGSTTGIELVQRIASEHAAPSSARSPTGLAPEIEAGPRRAAGDHGAPRRRRSDQAKVALGWVTREGRPAQAQRRAARHSPLTPLIELESLSLGIEGKRSLWLALAEVDAVAERIGRDRLAELIARAADQRERVEVHRRAAARRGVHGGLSAGLAAGPRAAARRARAAARRSRARRASSGTQNRITR